VASPWLIGGAALVGGYLLFREPSEDAARDIVLAGEDGAYQRALKSRARQYAPLLLKHARHEGMSPFTLYGILETESKSGEALTPPGPGGTNASGLDLGLMQINRGAHAAWVAANPWWDPDTNIGKGANVLADAFRYFRGKGLTDDAQLVHASLAAYNAGPSRVWEAIQAGADPDTVTSSGVYSQLVIEVAGDALDAFQREKVKLDTAQRILARMTERAATNASV
jgi:soluble lytic murein transglycosylase-like protein